MPSILIIGATTGIGRALAEVYARAGWQVAATGRRLELLNGLKSDFPENVAVLQADVCDSGHIAALESFVNQFGGPDVIVYNAGVGYYNKHMNWEPEATTIAVNVQGFTEVASWAYRYFRERGGGHFVGISSVAALIGSDTAPAYSASKAYEANYMEAMQRKARRDKLPIHITDIRPGFVDTPMTKGQKGMFWIATPEKAALQMAKAINRRKRVAYITQRWRVAAWVVLLWRLFRVR